jgi:DNA-binding CsgD family transcriptional regulator
LLSLSPRELQVALIVAHGGSNREAAAAVFLSPKTVEILRSPGPSRLTELI